MHKIRPAIIGALLGLGLLFTQAPGAFAIYSPVLSQEVTRIRGDIFVSRQQNGAGSWVSVMEMVRKDNKELQNKGEASGISGTHTQFKDMAKAIVVQAATESFLDGFKLLIPAASGISTCLRDDIWELQALQEEVLNELFKASLLSDQVNSDRLFADYSQLQVWIDGKTDATTVPEVGIKKNFDRAEWFPGAPNYYISKDCPFGSVTTAIDAAKVSFNRMIETFKVNFGSMGSINDMWNIAQKRSIQKAAAYIAKNQIQVSFGGEKGANPEGLINGSGVAGLSNTLTTAKELATNTFNSLHAGELFGAIGQSATGTAKALANYMKGGNRTLYDVNNEVQAALDQRKLALDRIYTPLNLGIQLNYVSENSLKSIEEVMVKINSKILEMPSKDSVKGACDKLNAILARQCSNKSSNAPVNCND